MNSLKGVPRATGANVLITDGNEWAIIEVSVRKLNVRRGEGVLAAANHYVREEMNDVQIPECATYPLRGIKNVRILESSFMRYKRIMELLKPNMTIEDIKQIFRDHYPEPGENSICWHGYFWHTLASIIILPKE